MNARLWVMVAAMVLTTATALRAQTPQPVPPRDPATPMPVWSLESLWQDIDCDCECDCCERIKQLIKKRLKDPKGRPMLAPRSGEVDSPRSGETKPRRQRDMEKRESRRRHPKDTASMWDRPWPKSGDRWVDAARTHKYRKALKKKRALDLSDEQRRSLDDLRHHSRLQAIDLRAALEKEQVELKRLMHDGDVSDDRLRKHIDAIAKIRADLEFNRLKTGLESRRALTPEQRDKLKKRSRRR